MTAQVDLAGQTNPDRPWADIVATPRSPARAFAAKRLFRLAVRDLPVRVCFPGGERLGAGDPDSPVMRIEHPDRFFHRLGVDAKIGFGESYMAGDWSSPDLADLLTPFAQRMSTLVPPPLQMLRRWVDARRPGSDRNTVSNARRNIHRHYDLSNELFAQFLDETMTYSAAWFAEPTLSLEQAQRRKIDAILDLAGVHSGTWLLEIGTGWGELALRAAQRGAFVTTLTISAQQQDLARKRIAEAGVADRVRVLLEDYRNANGRYDAVTSVEMIEAVGEEYWPTYFATIDRLLVPGGRVGIQAITMPHDRMVATRDSHTWIDKYIFPGGQVPSVRAIEDAVGARTRLRIDRRRQLGPDYARTLRLWADRFADNWPAISELGFDDTFRRMWHFYLSYAEAGFRGEYLDAWQFGMTK